MRILYVEDNEANRALVERVVRARKHTIVFRDEGEGALELLAEDKDIDFVLLDIELAGAISGIDVVKTLREGGDKRPIVAVTAYAMMGDRERILSAGCDQYLPKPLIVTDLLNLMDQYERELEGGPPVSKPAVTAGAAAPAAPAAASKSPPEPAAPPPQAAPEAAAPQAAPQASPQAAPAPPAASPAESAPQAESAPPAASTDPATSSVTPEKAASNGGNAAASPAEDQPVPPAADDAQVPARVDASPPCELATQDKPASGKEPSA